MKRSLPEVREFFPQLRVVHGLRPVRLGPVLGNDPALQGEQAEEGFNP